jgi:hypothetical protein
LEQLKPDARQRQVIDAKLALLKKGSCPKSVISVREAAATSRSSDRSPR